MFLKWNLYLLKNTEQDFDIIIIDSNSTDVEIFNEIPKDVIIDYAKNNNFRATLIPTTCTYSTVHTLGIFKFV